MKLWSEAYTKIKADLPWVVYQVNGGMTAPAFLIVLPMSELGDNDDLLSLQESMLEATEREGTAERLKQIAREAYVSTESNLYAVSPEMSHVPRKFSSGDPEFWRQGAASEAKPGAKPIVSPSRKQAYVKPPAGKDI
jgi:hypothetical protein